MDESGRARRRELTKLKEEQHPRSFQNPLNVHCATDHMIHQKTNSDHAKDVIEFITVEKNVKRNIGRGRIGMDTRRHAEEKMILRVLRVCEIVKK